ncbi:hypothetical protein N9940_00525 [bacterium]|nr:hypothetical protein [Akkermansiaceae bacterium]MDB4296059.1 hypothetical protein [bacterium]MDB4619722.1 hypothetical protein [Akkermansiaceae bacterium]MDB4641816.1 hypothetical protein [bacterium]
MHALGLTSGNIPTYIGVDGNGNAIGPNVVSEYGGPVPITGGHFDNGIQSQLWDSDEIICEAALDPDITFGNRKFLTKLDAAALRDIGYDVATTLADSSAGYELSIGADGQYPHLTWNRRSGISYAVHATTDFITWSRYIVGKRNSWTDPIPFGTKRFYYVSGADE